MPYINEQNNYEALSHLEYGNKQQQIQSKIAAKQKHKLGKQHSTLMVEHP